jgi:nucleotide-binding universal stress UspA family protein
VDGSGKVRRLEGRPVVVGYDGSAASDAAARWAAGAAQRLGRHVRMIHVMPWPALAVPAAPRSLSVRMPSVGRPNGCWTSPAGTSAASTPGW